jgi:hypothetical protein
MSIFRRALLLFLTAGLVLALAIPAAAGSKIRYRGETSAGKRISFTIVKKDSGQRSLRLGSIGFLLTCDDASTHNVGLGFQVGPLDEDGSFDMTRGAGSLFTYWFHIAGDVGFRSAEGTFEFRIAKLTDDPDPQPQLCTSGELTWTADRVREGRAGSDPAVPELRIDGELV